MIEVIPYRIARIETTQFAIFPEKAINGKEVSIKTNVAFSYKQDLSQIRNTLEINYSQGENLLLVLVLNCYYDVAPKGIESIKESGSIPSDFLRYMATISVGIARGVIHSKTEGSVLNPIVLPPINLVDIIREDMILNRNAEDQNQKENQG